MLEKITEILRDYKRDATLAITPETSFASLSLDSLETVELVMQLEEQLGISIDMDTDIDTVADLLAAVEKAG
jgi:acyl carrier protein